MRSTPPSSSATRATTATASATTWRSEASNPSSRHDRTARHQSNTIAKPTSDAISSSGASIASSNSGALPPDTRKPPELPFQCYASQQRNSGSKPSTRPRHKLDCERSSHSLGLTLVVVLIVLSLPIRSRSRSGKHHTANFGGQRLCFFERILHVGRVHGNSGFEVSNTSPRSG